MYKISVQRHDLIQFFDLHTANSPMLVSVLNGKNPGVILIDSENPSACIVRNNAGWTFTSKGINGNLLQDSINESLKYGEVELVWNENAQASYPKANNIINRLEFREHIFDAQLLQSIKDELPNEFQIIPIDIRLLKSCLWHERIISVCGTAENFIKNGIGFCVTRQSEIVAEAYAPFFGEQTAELGVVTNEKYRGQGLATIVCSQLIETCKEKGFKSYWSCNKDNCASIKVAKKLGFTGEKEYKLLVYET